MPTREEIVEWLNSVSEWEETKLRGQSALFRQRASQVAAMRCETCRYWVEDPRWNRDKVRECVWMGDKMTPPEYGCFQHEPREGE